MSTIQNKKIIFFDGDGTIWYPKETKRSKSPYWIYGDTNSIKVNKASISHLILSNTALATIEKLKQKNVKLILLSTHPHPSKIARKVLNMKITHLGIPDIFDEIIPTDGRIEAKGEEMLKILKRYKIPKVHALMVGDSYRYDYLSAKKAGIDVVLLKSSYLKNPTRGPRIKKLINEIEDVLKFV